MESNTFCHSFVASPSSHVCDVVEIRHDDNYVFAKDIILHCYFRRVRVGAWVVLSMECNSRDIWICCERKRVFAHTHAQDSTRYVCFSSNFPRSAAFFIEKSKASSKIFNCTKKKDKLVFLIKFETLVWVYNDWNSEKSNPNSNLIECNWEQDCRQSL